MCLTDEERFNVLLSVIDAQAQTIGALQAELTKVLQHLPAPPIMLHEGVKQSIEKT